MEGLNFVLECPICLHHISKRYFVNCPNETCKYTCCEGCLSELVAHSTDGKLKCPSRSCDSEWHAEQFPMREKYWLSHEMKQIEQMELAKLPETIAVVSDRVKEKEYGERIEILQAQIESLPTTFSEETFNLRNNLTAQLEELKQKRDEIIQSLHAYFTCNEEAQQKIYRKHIAAPIPCPSAECSGWLDATLQCSACRIFFCSACREAKTDDHVCNPELLASIKLIAKDTKKCPICFVPIVRVSGCPHMWCTQCHSFFDWNSLKLIAETSNPHYYEWRQQQDITSFIPETAIRKIAREKKQEWILQLYRINENYRQVIHGATTAQLEANLEVFLRKMRLYLLLNGVHHEDIRMEWLKRIAKKTDLMRRSIKFHREYEKQYATTLDWLLEIISGADNGRLTEIQTEFNKRRR